MRSAPRPLASRISSKRRATTCWRLSLRAMGPSWAPAMFTMRVIPSLLCCAAARVSLARRCILVDRHVGRDDDAVVGARAVHVDVFVEHVVEHVGGIALERIAVAAAAGTIGRNAVA